MVKVFKEDWSGKDWVARLLTEFIGTFFLTLTVGLAAAATGGALAPLAIGGCLMVMIYQGGHICGAHYNPAVTLAVTLRAKTGWLNALAYIGVQLLGGFLAALFATFMTPEGVAPVYPAVGIRFTTFQALVVEILWTCMLCYTVLASATVDKNKPNDFYGLTIGMSVTAAAFCGGPVSGGAFNPAVGTGTCIVAIIDGVSTGADDLWLYWVGPLLGACLAAAFFVVTNPEEFPSAPRLFSTISGPVMEFLGTFYLVLAVTMSSLAGGAGGLAIGLTLAIWVFTGGHVSGGQYNPAVSLGVWLRRAQSWRRMLVFWAVQILGGILAAFVGLALTRFHDPEGFVGTPDLPPVHPHRASKDYGIGAALFAEFFFTYALVGVVLNTATSRACMRGDHQTEANSFYGLAIGFTVFVGATSVGSISGGGFNPAVAIGTYIAAAADSYTDFLGDIWLYIVAPLLGGLAAALMYRLRNPGEEYVLGGGSSKVNELPPVGEPVAVPAAGINAVAVEEGQ